MSFLHEVVKRNNAAGTPGNVNRILLLYDDIIFFVGDTCRIFSYLPAIRSFYRGATIDVNIVDQYDNCYSLLEGNQHLRRLDRKDWKDLHFNEYDLVLTFCPGEDILLEQLSTIYGEQFIPAIYSFTFFLGKNIEGVFPPHKELWEYVMKYDSELKPVVELFLSTAERKWADNWLLTHGVGEDDAVTVFLDTSNAAEKVLSFREKLQMMHYLLSKPRNRMIIFDERGIGKREYYRHFLPPKLFERLIVVEHLSLRQEICLIASRFTKLVLGPCTGLMHCATGVYTHLLREGMPQAAVPMMLVYAGTETNVQVENNKWYWWRYSLVDCLAIRKEKSGDKYIIRLTATETDVQHPCSEFTASLLINYMEDHYAGKLAELDYSPNTFVNG